MRLIIILTIIGLIGCDTSIELTTKLGEKIAGVDIQDMGSSLKECIEILESTTYEEPSSPYLGGDEGRAMMRCLKKYDYDDIQPTIWQDWGIR